MKIFKNIHKNKDCVILTCGPSLNEYKKDIVQSFLKNKIVICVKESIIEYKDYADYFLSNGTRDRKYEFNNKTIKIFQGSVSKNKSDIIIREDKPFNINKQLLKIKNFEKYNFDNFIKRPWGPGILYETAFYLCLHMGIKNVYTIGWDLIDTNKETNITHYFDNNNSSEYKLSKRWNQNFRDEMILVNNNIIFMYDYFQKKGMNIFVIGEKSFVNRKIPRKYLNV